MGEISFRISTYNECKNDLLAFRNANRDSIVDLDYFEWRYLERPCDFKPIIIWAENQGGEKVGAVSIIPQYYSIDNIICPVGVIGDISVSKEWRRKGIARKMFIHLKELDNIEPVKLYFVLPNDSAGGVLKEAGWETVTKIDRYIKILRFEERIAKIISVVLLRRILCFALDRLAKTLSYEAICRKRHNYIWEVSENVDDRLSEFWNSLGKDGMIIGVRNEEHVRWRYLKHPEIKYYLFLLKDKGVVTGYIIYHFDEGNCYIADILSLNDGESSGGLLSSFIQYIRKESKASCITLKINKNSFGKLPLRKLGFIKRKDGQIVMAMLKEKEWKDYLAHGEKWYFTAGDKDV